GMIMRPDFFAPGSGTFEPFEPYVIENIDAALRAILGSFSLLSPWPRPPAKPARPKAPALRRLPLDISRETPIPGARDIVWDACRNESAPHRDFPRRLRQRFGQRRRAGIERVAAVGVEDAAPCRKPARLPALPAHQR